MLNVSSYLARIGYTGPTIPKADTLRAIHRAHLLTVPFENLDIARATKIVCEEDAFLRKIVDRHRGGFCYELNGAFAALLRGLGFEVTLLSARVPREDGTETPEFDHMTLRVDLDEPWLADVGFGDCFLEPLRLQTHAEQLQDGQKFRIREEGKSCHVERAQPDGSWKGEYTFSLISRRLEEFAPMCHYHQTSPESPFTRKRICSRATREGRITLADRKLIITRLGNREEKVLESEEEWQAPLQKYFQIVL
ncbi:MAG TPA: arylamine N-acetyltransferase [Terriglobales bacterium]|nr:arylamine N-acetyltransferase [Terriglobales bacterium]